MKETILRLTTKDLPETFKVGPHKLVTTPGPFLEYMQAELNQGPDSPRARTGVLQAECRALWEVAEQRRRT